MEYKVKIEILSPVHIGCDIEKNWQQGVDFVVKGGKVFKLNLDKILKSPRIDTERLSSALAAGKRDAIAAMLNNIDIRSIADRQFGLPVNGLNIKEIRPNIYNQLTDKAIIPGSSLKGAIRSILLNKLIKERPPKAMDSDRLDETEYFGTIGDSFMKYLRISDIEFESTALINTKIYNLQRREDDPFSGGWKKSPRETDDRFSNFGFNTVYEAIMPQSTGYGRITIEKDKITDISDIESLFSLIKDYSDNYIRQEENFFETYGGDSSNIIIDSLAEILDNIPADDNDSCVLRLGAGSGFHSITGNWQFEKHDIDHVSNYGGRNRGMYDKRKSAKSRKIAIWDGNGTRNFAPMGFIKITVL